MPKRSEIRRGQMLKPAEEDASIPRSAEDTQQFNVPKDVEEDKKVKPKDVFEGYKETKKTKKPTKKMVRQKKDKK